MYLGIPPPIDFVDINFSFNVHYSIQINLTASAWGITPQTSSPYYYKLAALATTLVTSTA
jgi:hypothetical protein